MTETTHRNFSVIIIGAGASGIAAATKLLENGVEDILMLEAENRIGGRISSVKFGDAYVDAGAEFCHGENNNIVYQLAKDFDVLKHGREDIEMYCSNGEKICKELAKEIYEFVELYEDLERNGCDPYTTIGSFVVDRYNDLLLKKYKDDPQKLRICEDALSSVESIICAIESSFSWFKPTLNTDYRKCSGDVELNWNGLGYKTILQIMMNKFADADGTSPLEDKILFNKLATRIIWDDNFGKVEVICSDGRHFLADHVIFTPSVGVLKQNVDKIFSPQLPQKKRDCIRTLGYDAIIKVHLWFPEKWWPEDFTDHIFVWRKEDKEKLVQEFPYGPMKDGHSWLENVCNISPAANNPNVLLVWMTGEHVPELENTSSKIIIDGIMHVIEKFLGLRYEITYPDSMIHSSWYSNPNFRGTYSYETVDSLKLGYNCHEELATPLFDSEGRPTLYFAGEATSTAYYSTVHGAIESGYRVSNMILEHRRKSN